MASQATPQPTLEQKVLQTATIAATAASQIANVWGHSTVASLVGEVPALAPAVVGFLDAIIAATNHPALKAA
jgi:hypothetical protein